MPSRVKNIRPSRGGGGGGCGGLCGCLFCLVLIGVGIFLGVYLTDAESPADLLPFDPREFIPDWESWGIEDPFNKYNASDPDDLPRWDNNGNGLQLEIVNALDSQWDSFFDQAVAEWDAGEPDVLQLSTSSEEAAGLQCSPIEGKMIVCNANYGDTQWNGINEVMYDQRTGEIYNSVAKMNEFYLENADDGKKQYTMCHEIGHGFGLPHTDETFWNKDTGECMDYTNHPANNMHPGPDNFAFLAEMYGTLSNNNSNRKVRLLRPLLLVKQQQQRGGSSSNSHRSSSVSTSRTVIPDWVFDKYKAIIPHLESNNEELHVRHGARFLERNEHASVMEVDLGEGFVLQVRKLLVSETD